LGLGVLLRSLHRNRSAAPGLHPALRLDMAAHIKNLAVKNNMRINGVQYSLKVAPYSISSGWSIKFFGAFFYKEIFKMFL